VLRILHHRRTSGSLADYGVDNLGQQYTHVNRSLATKALDWLREAYPIDEARAAEEWAEKEANRIAYELWLADPENDSKYKDPARAFREQQKKQKEEQAEQEALQERYEGRQKIGMLHVGPSEFERNIAERRRERLEAVTQKAEEKEAKEQEHEAKLATGEWVRTPSGTQLMKPGQTTYVDLFGREQVSRRKQELEKYQHQAQTEFKDEVEMLSKTTVVRFPQPSLSTVADPPDRPNDSTQCLLSCWQSASSPMASLTTTIPPPPNIASGRTSALQPPPWLPSSVPTCSSA